MSADTISFTAWAILMLFMLAGIAVAARRSRQAHEDLERAASSCLPEIGRIAEKKHRARFGSASTKIPTGREENETEWYPKSSSKVIKHL